MNLDRYYIEQYVKNENGQPCQVLDVSNLPFGNVIGRKSSITKVIRAKGGEKIITSSRDGEIEDVVVAEKNDCIFCNSETDIYIFLQMKMGIGNLME